MYPNYIRAVQGHQHIDPRWLITEELTEDVTGEVYHITDLKRSLTSKEMDSRLEVRPPSVKWYTSLLAILFTVEGPTQTCLFPITMLIGVAML